MIDEGAFLEHALVFGNHYGTSRLTVEVALATGKDVILEIDWQGAALVRKALPASVSIFIVPPSQKALESRLLARAQDDTDVIEARLAEARGDMAHYPEFDYLVINDDYGTALAELTSIIQAERCRVSHRAQSSRSLMAELLATP
jgi:guanylate kinase